MPNDYKPKIALSIGDPAGIGPEVCIKAVLSEKIRDICKPVIIGDAYVLESQARLCKLPFNVDIYNDFEKIDWSKQTTPLLNLGIFQEQSYKVGKINAINGKAALAFASRALSLGKVGKVDGIVAAPHTQSAIAKAGISFDGYPAFVANETDLAADKIILMLCFDDFRIAHCTLHVSVKTALGLLTQERVKLTIRTVHDSLKKMGIENPKIIVSGVNPHAGENGLFGNEDIEIVTPAIEHSRSQAINVTGPIGADTMFHLEDVDAFIVMLHDQGHIPAKLLARHRTVAMSIGGPVLFSSVAHGSALDIAGKGEADASAIIEAISMLSGFDNHS